MIPLALNGKIDCHFPGPMFAIVVDAIAADGPKVSRVTFVLVSTEIVIELPCWITAGLTWAKNICGGAFGNAKLFCGAAPNV